MSAVSQTRSRLGDRFGAASPTLASCTDSQLMALIAGSDSDALAALYDRHAGIAYGLALRVAGDAGLAEEAVQDGFLSVWQGAGSFDDRRGTARNWLLTIVHRRAVDLVNKAARRRERPTDCLPEGEHPSAAATMELAGERQRVRVALDALPFAQRQALELGYYGGLSQAQIAEQVGVPLGTVKSRTYVALSTLRNALVV